jgi:hypothetical protein
MPVVPPQLMSALQADFIKCADELDKDDNPFWRRTLFRTGFAMIEAFNFYFADMAIKAHSHAREARIDITAIGLLNRKRFRLDDEGNLRGSEQRHSLVGFSAFLVKTLADATGVTTDYFQESGWTDLRRAVKVRNRITHPKSPEDMVVAKEEVDALVRGISWFVQSLHDIARQSDFIHFED